MKALIERLKKDRLTIGSCESLTAGLFASTIAEVSGASAVLKGGIVTYWTECKVNVVHVREEIVEIRGCQCTLRKRDGGKGKTAAGCRSVCIL